MTRVRALAPLILGLTCTLACNDDTTATDDEADETGSDSTDAVATFDGSSDDAETTTEESTGSTDTGESTSTETDSGESTDTDTGGSTETGTDTGTGTDTDTGTDTGGTGTDTGSDTSTDTGSTDTGGTTEGDEPPFVVTTTPADLETGVAAGTQISVEFSELMDPATVTTNTADKTCSGTVQVSFDGFLSCVQMAAAPSTGDDINFALSPVGPLTSTTVYQIRVLADVTDAGGTAMLADFTTATGFQVRYFHTIVIDGANDFTGDESFPSSTPNHTGYVAWDDSYLYLGMSSPDLAADDPMTWFVAYLGGLAGTTSGVLYNTQQPAMPFEARWHLRWKASDDFGGALEWDGGNWVDPGFGPMAGSEDVAASADFVELRVAWADLGDPELVALHLGMLREEAFNEASWAPIPAGSYVDGYDPDYMSYYEFDRLASLLPVDYDVL